MKPKLSLAIAAFLALTAVPAWALDWAGVVTRSKGQVLIERGSERVPAPAGTELRRGDRLVTGADGQALVRMKGSAPLNIGPRASVTLDRYIADEPQAEKALPPILQGLASFFAVNRRR